MILSDTSVVRPVFATVLGLLLVIFGLVAYSMLPLREYPDIDPPVVSIETSYRGAAASVVDSQITQLIEESGMPYSCKIAQVLILHALGHVKGEYRKHTDAPLQSNDHEERTIMGTTMSKEFSNAQRAAAGQAILQMDLYWAEAFAETGMSDLNYCDLFTHLWLIREQEALPKPHS